MFNNTLELPLTSLGDEDWRFTAGTILNDTICINKIILTPTIKIWLYQLMLI